MFCSNHFFTWLPYSFLSFFLTLPLIFSLTAVKVREWKGRPGFREGVGCRANSRSNTFPFLVLEPPLPLPLCQCLGSRPGCYGNSKALRNPWLPFLGGLCPFFLAGPLPITLTCPLPAYPRLYPDCFPPSPLGPSQLCAVSISLLSLMVHLSPSLRGLPPHHQSFPSCFSLTPHLCFLALPTGAPR